MKVIETHFHGHLFRSRLEARWAVFYDTLGIPWEYEKEGYDLGGAWYLPDFWLPNHDCFVEIKGKAPSLEEEVKASILAQQSKKFVFIFFGPIPSITRYGQVPGDRQERSNSYMFGPDITRKDDLLWAQCPNCLAIEIIKPGTGYDYCGDCSRGDTAIFYDTATDLLVEAYHNSRTARF